MKQKANGNLYKYKINNKEDHNRTLKTVGCHERHIIDNGADRY